VSAPRLEVDGLGYGYPGHPVGHGISFTVDAGEVLCVLGRNGEGKSTLFKTILGCCRRAPAACVSTASLSPGGARGAAR
jgi:ABC-type cobalamin/Fe3+-siderophores transport system ATPase subunit